MQFEVLARQAAARLGLSEACSAAPTRRRPPASPPRPAGAASATAPSWPAEERLLIELMASDRAVAPGDRRAARSQHFRAADLRDAGDADRPRPGRTAGRSAKWSTVCPAALGQLLAAAAMGDGPSVPDAEERSQAADDCLRRIDGARRRARNAK